jgi:hypothetical protein
MTRTVIGQMKNRNSFFAVVLLLAAQAWAQTPTPAKLPSQVDPYSDLAKLYPAAGNIGLTVAVMPDPQVPRYRRLFDLGVQAITLGMLNDGYVLDRYSFASETDSQVFGLMLFRCDGWRGHPCQDVSTLPKGSTAGSGLTTRVRAVYIVTDTATWGVATRPLVCATRKIRDQLAGIQRAAPPPRTAAEPRGTCPEGEVVAATAGDPPRKPRIELLQFPGRCRSVVPGKTLVVLGPNFSGAMDSIGENVGELLGPEIADVCLVSSTTTNSSNPLAVDAYENLHYVRLAADDGVKLLRLSNMAEAYGYFSPTVQANQNNNDVAFLTEASTFGYGVCKPSQGEMTAPDLARITKFCHDAAMLRFPAAVADIRHGIDQQRETQQNSVQTAMKATLSDEHLTLDVGAENGNEFPESRQSKLTAASQQLALDHVLEQLETYAPKMVIVVATDVRDRLFLFDRLRSRLPKAMLIDLETDILLAHPDFLHASRGAVTVASANLFVRRGRLYGCENGAGDDVKKPRIPLASWALDGQGILADAVSRLHDSGQTPTMQPCILLDDVEDGLGARSPILHVVTLNGLRRISRAFDRDPNRKSDRTDKRRFQEWCVDAGQWLSVICCFVIVLPWLWFAPLRKAKTPALFVAPRKITAAAATAGFIAWLFAIGAAYLGEDPESGYALMYWSLGVLSVAIAGLHQCLKRVQETGQTIGDLPRRHRCGIAIIGLFACAMSAAPIIAGYRYEAQNEQSLDVRLMTRLALDIGQGLAFEVIVALGVVTVLAIMVALATGLCIKVRNNRLLEIPARCREIEAGARTPKFSMAPVLAVVLFIALIAVPCLIPALGGPRLTVFGPRASLIATLVLVVTTLGASLFTVVAIHSSRRVRTISAHIGRCVSPPPAPGRTEPPPGEYPGLWPANEWQPDLFATTPIVAQVSTDVVGSLIEDKERPWKMLINEFLGKCDGGQRSNDGHHRRAVFALLASEISLYRWLVAGSVLCASASVCAAYLFPLEADALLMWNLLVLVVHALLAGYVATSFERDGVLSNILCNRPKKAVFSASLFTYAALPFIALGFAIAVSQVPGVVDWGGGLLALLKAVGIGF